MRIGITSYPTVGGSGSVAAELGVKLAQRGHSVHFISHRAPLRLDEYHANLCVHDVDHSSTGLFEYPPFELALAAKMADVVREERLELLHVHYAIPNAVTAHLARELLGDRAPRLVTTLHGTDVTLVGQDRSFQEITRFGIDRSDGITAVSEYLKDETVRMFQPAKPIEVIHNFIDGDVYSPALRSDRERAKYGHPGELLIGHLSNFRPVKRACDVVRMFHKVQRQLPARLLLMGKGVDLDRARGLAADLGIQERVEFLGAIHDVPRVLAQLDLFVLPSEYESFGLAALESMACGVPVISTRTGGVPELVEQGVSGFLCPVGDPECMARPALELRPDSERHRAMGRAARERALEHFPLERAVARYESYYHEVLGRPS